MLNVYTKTDMGKVRETNQDSCSWGRLGGDGLWAVVCDGMGGANGGNIASAMAIEIISEKLAQDFSPEMDGEEVRDLMDAAVMAANCGIFDMANEDSELSGMGTTVVMAVIVGNTAQIANVGDSRIYSIVNGEINQLSTDHSMVQMLVDIGEITPEEAKHHPKKNIITRAVGVDDTVDIDFCEYTLKSGERLLLCSDGLTNFVEDDELRDIVEENDGQKAVELLVENANENGGGDNITVVLIEGETAQENTEETDEQIENDTVSSEETEEKEENADPCEDAEEQANEEDKNNEDE